MFWNPTKWYLPRVIIYLRLILKRIYEMNANLDRITAAIAAEDTQIASLIALTNGLAQAIRDNATDPAALSALADDIEARTTELSDAVTANTPAATP